jgi:hypothetical protein
MRAMRRRPQRMAMMKSFAVATSGLIANQNRAIASERMPTGQVLRGAAVMENWFPTATGARVRGGYSKHATVGAPTATTALMSYRANSINKLFVATASAVYDITSPADPSASPAAAFSGQTGGDWIGEQFANAGGVFLRAVNGTDTPRVFDGTSWSTSPTITGVTAANLNYVWAFKNRLWFVIKESLSAAYLSVDQIGGAAVELPLAGVFTLGGNLLFGATISADSGDGMDDRIVFVTSEGQAAVFEGSDPSSAATWQLVGVYRIGRPLGKRAFMRTGGDIVIATDMGMISLQRAMTLDYAALSPSAVSSPIETLWTEYVIRRQGNWQVMIWPRQRACFVAVPANTGDKVITPIVNVQTGAWCQYTGMPITCMVVFGDRFFWGDGNGKVYEAESSGMDDGLPFTATYVPLFDDLKSPATRKFAKQARAVVIAPRPLGDKLSCQADYDITIPAAPDDTAAIAASQWGVGIWGEAVWSDTSQRYTYQAWRSVSATGYALAPCYQITSGSVSPADAELVRIDLTYEQGSIVS